MVRWKGALGLIVGLWFTLVSPVFAYTSPYQEVWIAPNCQPLSPGGPCNNSEFMKTFDVNHRWLLSYTNVFKLYSQFVAYATDADLTLVLSVLQSSGVKIALESGVLTTNSACPFEGQGGEWLGTQANRIKSLGGTIDYVAADEPVNFILSCESQIPGLTYASAAADAAHNFAAVTAVFPNAQLGDIEQADSFALTAVSDWLDAYKTASGTPFAFLHNDAAFDSSSIWSIKAMYNVTAARAPMKYGVIYNDGVNYSEQNYLWGNNMLAAAQAVKHIPFVPQTAIIQSWQIAPARMFSDIADGTFSYVMKYILGF